MNLQQRASEPNEIYTDKIKYSGENNNFDYKLVIFYNLCNKADMLENIKIELCLTCYKA